MDGTVGERAGHGSPEGRAGCRQQKAPSGCLVIVRMMDRGWEGGGGGPILVSKSEF